MRKIIFALAFGALFVPDYGFTLGLGEIEVTSALNQELNAEIELLSAAPEDVETLIVKLASREEFIRAGIDRPYMLNSLKFSAEIRDGGPYIKVTSDKPVREPFLNFLVEIDWPKGHMMREYTILLDPPVFMQQQAPVQQQQMRPAAMDSSRPATPAVPEPQSSSGFRPAAMGMAATSSAAMPAPTSASVPTSPAQTRAETQAQPAYTQGYYQSPAGYRVQQGDTLWSLGDSMRPDQSVTIEQMMLAILRNNPEAFINENVNGLKRGYILRIPDRDDITAVNQAEAIALVREQNALWREYQQAIASSEPASAMDTESEAGAGIGLDDGGEARLEIVAAGSGTSASGLKDPTRMSSSELRAELAIARESLETERVEKEELLQRVNLLEGQVDRMKSLLTLEDTDLAEMQQAAMPAEGDMQPVIEGTEAAVEEAAELAVDEALIDEGAVAEDMTLTEEAGIEEGVEQPVFVDEDQPGQEQMEVVEEVVEQPVAPVEDIYAEPVTQPTSLQDRLGPVSALLNNPLLLAAAGGGLLVILLLIALIMKRRKAGAEETVVASNLEDITDLVEDMDVATEVDAEQVKQEMAEAEAAAAAATTTEEQLDTESAAEAPAEETVSKPEAEQEPRDDVIAEADVYLAYGIYQQAEELLQNAIKENPDNDSYRVKLAETYLAGKNADALIELATEMNQRRAGEDTPAWRKVVAIGKELSPDHALFAGMVSELSMDDLASQSPEPMDVDLGTEEEPDATLAELDLGIDEKEAGIADQIFEPDESVEFDLAETGAEALTEVEDDQGVEFDLAEAGAEAEAEAEAEQEQGVEFDLTETQALEPEQDEAEFALDIEADELGIEEEPQAETTGDDVSFDLDLSADAEEALTADDETEALTLEDVDEGSLEFAAEDEAEEAPDEAPVTLDLTEEVVEESVAEALAEPDTVASDLESIDDGLDLSDLDDVDEVSTKLDLAKAYLDMGDADGTRSILDEVMTEGNNDQKKEAEELLSQLG